ncbi:hypothetical protein ES703_51196 [subsurface metagenome]
MGRDFKYVIIRHFGDIINRDVIVPGKRVGGNVGKLKVHVK